MNETTSLSASVSAALAEYECRMATEADTEMLGEMALLAGKVALRSGLLEEAYRRFSDATRHGCDAGFRRRVAGDLLVLAQIWGEGTSASLDVTKEQILRKAAMLDPSAALPLLARYLQKDGRAPEAISVWNDAVRANPRESASTLSLARAYEQSGDLHAAIATYLDLIGRMPTLKNYLTVAPRLDALHASMTDPDPRTGVRIALLGNATLNHLESFLKVECYRAGFRPSVHRGGFDQYTQEILDSESALYSFKPEVVILAIHASRLFPRIQYDPFELSLDGRQAEVEAGLLQLQNLLDVVAERCSGLVLVHTMVVPQHPALGVLDWRDELGQTELFGQINTRLAALVRTRYRNVYLLDEERVQATAGKERATDPRLWLTSRLAWSEGVLMGLSKQYVRYITGLKGQTRKCIVLDLDNTLWGGVVGEDGVEGIELGSEAPGNSFVAFQRELERLRRRGVLLAVCSKNNLEDVRAVFKRHPGMVIQFSTLAAYRINWETKVDNLRDIARELNIGLDSIVFLDDNPAERAHVQSELPQVLTPELPADPAYYRHALLELDVFDSLTLTQEDRDRSYLYEAQRARQAFQAGRVGSSLDEYLAELEMVVDIEPVRAGTLSRVAQLTNKTNQFNLTTRRYSEREIEQMRDAGREIYAMRVLDRFGDNGLVGVAILAPLDAATMQLDTFLLSCRVIGRRVETAFLAFLTERARERHMRWLQGWYLPTGKNGVAETCYADHGFTLVEQGAEGNALWTMDLQGTTIDVPSWLTVRVA